MLRRIALLAPLAALLLAACSGDTPTAPRRAPAAAPAADCATGEMMGSDGRCHPI